MLNISKTRYAFLRFNAPKDNGGGGGGSDTPKPQSLTLEQQLSKARDDLAAKDTQIGTLTSERDQARTDLATRTSERDNLQTQFDSLTTTATETKTKLTTAESTVTDLTNKNAKLTTDLAASAKNVTRLEKLCDLKGISHQEAPADQGDQNTPSSTAEFETRIKAAKTPAERQTISAEYEKALAEGRIRD